jgi:serine/threonine protein phosphatase PrpC
MTLAVIDTLSLPGDAARTNEDAFGHNDHAAVVMDGATPLGDSPGDGLMPGPSDAAWIAQFGARRLLAHLRDGAGGRKALRGALADAQKSFAALRRMPPKAMWQTPCASMMMIFSPSARSSAGAATGTSPASALARAQGRATEMEFLWFGDCAALVAQDGKPVQVIGDGFDRRAAEAGRAAMLAKEKGVPPAARLPDFIEALRVSRNRIGSGGHWLFMPDVKAATHVSRRVLTLAPGAVILLASDGFLALASDYGAYSADTLMAAAQDRGLDALGEELRAIEAADPGGETYPRFKSSDDATALLLRIV